MGIRQFAPLALVCALAACSGNPLNNGGSGGGGGGGVPAPGPGPVIPGPCCGGGIGVTAPVVVPDALKGNVSRVLYNAAADTFQIEIVGLDTTPVLATWAPRPDLAVPGYRAYSVQADPLDRMFIGLAAESSDHAVRAAVGGDGGQFNASFSGTTFERTGTYTPPPATGSGPATGQVSYAGDYAGLMNGGGTGALLPVPDGTDPSLIPGQPARVTGQAFLNANFADNTVNGSVYNRVVVDTGFGLESIVLVPTTIAANGTFGGTVQRPALVDPNQTAVGSYAGVFGGTNAAHVAGALQLTSVYDASPNHTLLNNAQERGIFVLRQCGLAGDSPVCAGVAP